MGDTDTEYWTFIKRTDTKITDADLYNTNNCPNCGAALEENMGEVSRCHSCGTLTNNAAYDWVLSEITQADDYDGNNNLLQDQQLQDITKNDPLFSVQRMEDIASNVFMQIMEVLTENNEKKLTRFASPDVADKIRLMKNAWGSFVFDRLYLNSVTLAGYRIQGDKLHCGFNLTVSYQRVQLGGRLKKLDGDIGIHHFTLTLSKDLSSLRKPEKEVVFSHECANCGAPYTDTTEDTCSYCGAPVVDFSKNWVLTAFNAG
jgi:DNA-directed RNA polymerase subunit RPC12/RpoP